MFDKAAYNREYKKQNKEKINAANRAYRKSNPKKVETWRASSASANRKAHLKTYGITPEDYEAMFIKQNGRCAICGVHQSEIKKSLRVDHDHKTGKVRGLLCHHCNVGAGHFKDDPTLLRKAANYMRGGR